MKTSTSVRDGPNPWRGFLPEILFARLAARVVGCVTALSELCKN